MVDGLSLDQNSGNYRKKIGYIPESPLLYEELTLKEHLELTALAYDLDKKEALQKSIDLLKLFRLEDKLDWFPTTFSKGMQQKVMIICAFLVQPALYIIDEPFMGLDPLAINDLIALMNQAKAGGAAILMSTHILSNAEKFCDKFIVLKDGEVAADGNMEDLRRQFDTENKRASSLEEIYLKLTSNLTAGEARHARTF